MSIESILEEIDKREHQKETLFNELLQICKDMIEKLSIYRESNITFRPEFPQGVIGRRLSDKILYFETVLKDSLKIEKSSVSDLETIEKAIKLIIQHFKTHANVFKSEDQFTVPGIIEDIKSQFIILASLQKNVQNLYIANCLEEIKHKMVKTSDRISKIDLKNAYDIYGLMQKHMSYHSVARIKLLNDESGSILSPADFAKEYKMTEDNLWNSKERLEAAILEREKFKNAAKHLSQLQKNESKSRAYEEEINKHLKKLDVLEDDARFEIEDLIASYKEANKIMQEEIQKVQNFLMSEFGVKNEEEYHIKNRAVQVEVANLEVEINRLTKRSELLEKVVADIHECRRKANASRPSGNF